MAIASTTFQRWRVASAGLAAALVLAFAAVFTPQGQAAAQQFLAQFRSQRFTAVTVDPRQASPNPLVALEHYGTISGAQGPTRDVAVQSVAEASQRVGFPVAQPDPASLPPQVSRTPRVLVLEGREVRFTFDRAKALAYAASLGEAKATFPEKFDGASLVVAVPTAALLGYPEQGASSGDRPGLLIGQARELTVSVESPPGRSVTLDEMREFLLGLPGLPPDTVRQLRNIQDWHTTLPIPIPADRVDWQQTTVNGQPALILNDNSGIGSGLLWQQDGRVFGVGGAAKADDLKRVAESLK